MGSVRRGGEDIQSGGVGKKGNGMNEELKPSG